MEPRFRVRLDELLEDAEGPPGLTRGLLSRLERFLEPFVLAMCSPERRGYAHLYVQGLLSDLKSKDAESIAYLHDRDRQGLQEFLGQADWGHAPLLDELARQVGHELGQTDAVLGFDPSASPKKGDKSVGAQRQWCGRLGKVENCQVGVCLGYVSREEHALVDFRLYLPQERAADKPRRREAGVPAGIRFRTRHRLALDMLDQRGAALPHGWVAGDDEFGRSAWFRRELRARGEPYLLAVPSNTLARDLAADDPPYRGRGRKPRAPFVRADAWARALPESAWETIDVRDGEKGPLLTQAARALVQARAETLVVFRERQADGTWKHGYLLSSAVAGVPLAEFARVLKAQHRVEECLRRAKSEAGLADYQVRTRQGWQHHQALALVAAWSLTKETGRGKNPDPGVDGAPAGRGDRGAVEPGFAAVQARATEAECPTAAEAQRGGAALSLASPQTLAAMPL
jgi:SRSO17 transposase